MWIYYLDNFINNDYLIIGDNYIVKFDCNSPDYLIYNYFGSELLYQKEKFK